MRVSVNTGLQLDIETAKQALDALKASSSVRFDLVADDLGAAQLPAFVKRPQAITDGHLLELAKKEFDEAGYPRSTHPQSSFHRIAGERHSLADSEISAN